MDVRKMLGAGLGLAIVLGGVALAVSGVWAMGAYNGFGEKQETVNAKWAQVENQMQRRLDLIPNLVETVKGYAAHERETLEAVIQARNTAMAAEGPDAQARAETALTGALGKLFALAEAYPDLKANTNFLQLQQELSLIEDKLAAARRFYNSAVQDYNTAREQFPGSIIAGMYSFEPRSFFDVGEARAELSTVPKVDFQ